MELAAQDDVAAALPAQVSLSAPPSHGTATLKSDGAITYTPDKGFDGTDTVAYSVTDNDGAVSTAKLTITVASDTSVVPGPDPDPDPEPEPETDTVVDPVDTSADDDDQTLPDTGAPAMSTLWLSLGLVGVGSAAVVAAGGRRSGQHRG